MFFCCCSSPTVDTAGDVVIDAQPALATAETVSAFASLPMKREHDAKWGLVLDGWSDCVQIIDVKDGGKIQEYNESAGSEEKINPGDFVVEIDGKQVTKESAKTLKDIIEADLKIARPATLHVHIENGMRADGMGWGLKLSYQKNRSTCARIDAIHEGGGVAEFNKGAEVAVQERDFIVEVNGCRGDPAQMLEVFKTSYELDLTLMRLP